MANADMIRHAEFTASTTLGMKIMRTVLEDEKLFHFNADEMMSITKHVS